MKRIERRRCVSPSKVKDEAFGVGRNKSSFAESAIDQTGIEFSTYGKTEHVQDMNCARVVPWQWMLDFYLVKQDYIHVSRVLASFVSPRLIELLYRPQ